MFVDTYQFAAVAMFNVCFQFPKMDPSTDFKSFCKESDSQIAIGDFDGDNRMDVVCRMDQGQEYKIALSDGDGFLVNVDFEFGQR